MTDEEIGEMLEALCDLFTLRQLKNRDKMLKELAYFTGQKKKALPIILEALIEYKKLRGNIKPLWAAGMQEN